MSDSGWGAWVAHSSPSPSDITDIPQTDASATGGMAEQAKTPETAPVAWGDFAVSNMSLPDVGVSQLEDPTDDLEAEVGAVQSSHSQTPRRGRKRKVLEEWAELY